MNEQRNILMNIASITVYCNEEFRLDSWITYYNEYANYIKRHIIINNGNKNDTAILSRKFPQSTVIYSKSKALTTSYNLGIKIALEDEEIDSILLIGNDIKIDSQNVSNLYQFLFSRQDFGMVAPVLLQKDSDLVEVFGAQIDYSNLQYKHLNVGESLIKIANHSQISDSVPGGVNLAKRSFYETLGLQDENLFMYADEIDTGIKAKKKGIVISSTIHAVAWHQHVDRSIHQVRPPLAGYLKARNSIYLAHKHFNKFKVLNCFIVWFSEALRINASAWVKNKSKDHKVYSFYFLLGTIAGLFNNKKLPKQLLK